MRVTFGKKLRSRRRTAALTLSPLTFTVATGRDAPTGQGTVAKQSAIPPTDPIGTTTKNPAS
jgi:hypothetical protein